MFDKINELFNALNNSKKDFSIYKNAKETRKILQAIKVEAQNLRNKVTENFKNKVKAEWKEAKGSEETITHNITEEEVRENNLEGIVEAGDEIEIPVEEPKLVNEDDDFFDKQ